MDFTLYWFMFPVSIIVATCAMLSGIGGAALFTPIFILVFPLLGEEYVLASTMTAVAAALFTQTFGFLSGFIGYYRRKLIDYQLARRILRVSIPVAILGAVVANYVSGSVLVASGDFVTTGQPLARVGNSGNSSEPHLHISAQRPGSTPSALDGGRTRSRIRHTRFFRPIACGPPESHPDLLCKTPNGP